jgi:hypothetical protein
MLPSSPIQDSITVATLAANEFEIGYHSSQRTRSRKGLGGIKVVESGRVAKRVMPTRRRK